MDQESGWPDDLIALVTRSGTLCLDVDDPGWDSARGYLFDQTSATLYLPVAKKFLAGDLAHFQVLIWSQPRLLVTGELSPATSAEDLTIQRALAEYRGMALDKAEYMLLDQRTKKPRKIRYKLVIQELSLVPG
ncbi:MAG TPA: hypothetical protein VN816_06670 [Acidimicrobiales bacterium]|nr:hypothetical protein [Acidimicrobiales bacterium]